MWATLQPIEQPGVVEVRVCGGEGTNRGAGVLAPPPAGVSAGLWTWIAGGT